MRLPLPASAPAACRAALLAGGALLAGCAAPPVPVLPDATPAAWTHAPATPAAAAPDLRRWWQAFGDARLDALVDEALRQNLTLAQAESRLRQARLLSERADAAYRPSLSASVRTVQDVQAVDSYLHASLDATWELGLFGARESAGRIARATLANADAAVQAARVSLVAEVVRQAVEWRAAERQTATLDRLAALDTQALALADVRLRTRIAAPDERLQLQARAAQTEAQRAEAVQAADRAAQALALLTGRFAPDPGWNGGAPLQAPAAGIAALPADLLRTRPDVRQAEAAVLKAAGEAGLARAELYPRIALGGSYLYARNLTQNRRYLTDQIPVIGPLIDIPLFDWGRRQAQAAMRGEALNEALLAYRQAVLEGVADTETALSALAQQQARAARLDAAAGALRQRRTAQQVLQRQGLGSGYDLLGADRALLLAEAERAGADTQQALAFVALYKALGGAPLPAASMALAEAPR